MGIASFPANKPSKRVFPNHGVIYGERSEAFSHKDTSK